MATPVPPESRAGLRVAIASFCGLVIVLAITGCSASDGSRSAVSSTAPGSPVEARPPGIGPFSYPLAVGNRWRYAAHSTIRLVDALGSHPISEWDTSQQDELTGVIHVEGLDYFHQQTAYVDNGEPASSEVLLRQDRTGLFDRPVPADAPAAASVAGSARTLAQQPDERLRALAGRPDVERLARHAALLVQRTLDVVRAAQSVLPSPSVAEPGELTLLRYPLTPASSWDVGASIDETREVIGRMQLLTPAGQLTVWRVRAVPAYFDSRDQLEFWYADVGYAGYRVHTEDVVGTGTLVMDSEGKLAEVRLN